MLEDPIKKVIDNEIANLIRPILEEIINSREEKIDQIFTSSVSNFISLQTGSYSQGPTKLELLIDKLLEQKLKGYIDKYFDDNFKELTYSVDGDSFKYTNQLIEDIIVSRSGDILKNLLAEQVSMKMRDLTY